MTSIGKNKENVDSPKSKTMKFSILSDYIGFDIFFHFPLILNLGVLNCPFNFFFFGVLATAGGI